MDFVTILKELIKKSVACINSSNFDGLDELLKENIHFTAQEYNSTAIKEPTIQLNNKEYLFSYWRRIYSTFPFEIKKIKFQEVA